MQKIFLDSNLLVYFKDNLSSFHRETLSKLEYLMKQGDIFCISPLVLDEFLYVLTYQYKNKKKAKIFKSLKKALGDILKIPQLEIINSPSQKEAQTNVVDYMEKYNLCPRDAYHLLTMIYNKIDAFATFDNDFKKVFENSLISKV